MEWNSYPDKKPKQKDLVLCWNGEITIPAIYYRSLGGFYFFSTYYHYAEDEENTVYSKARIKPKHEIKGVLKWRLIDKPQ